MPSPLHGGGGTLLIDPNAGTSTALTLGNLTATAAGGSFAVGNAIGAGSGTVAITTTTNKGVMDIYAGRIVFANGTLSTGYDWATTASVAAPYTLAAYGGYSALDLTTGTDTLNSRITASQTLGGSRVTNTLKIENPAASQSLDLGTNLFAGTIGDAGGVVRITKLDAGTWALSGANTYSGVTRIAAGTLIVSNLANGALPSSIGQSSSIAGNLVLNGGTLMYAPLH